MFVGPPPPPPPNSQISLTPSVIGFVNEASGRNEVR